MEGLAAASSIAGILSLAGQTIDGILKLQGFFEDVSSASRTMERFLSDINLLIKTIEDIRSLLGGISDTITATGTNLKVVALEIQLQDCSKDVHKWLRIWSNYHPGFSTGSKASFKKFWVAANKAGVLGISQEIKGHRQSLIASLSVLGRTLDVANCGKLESIHDILEHEAKENELFRRNSTTQLTKIDSLEAQSIQSLKFCKSSKSSLYRIASSLSRIERCISSSQRAASFVNSLAEDTRICRRSSLSPISSCCSESPPFNILANHKPSGKRQYLFALGGSSTSGDSSDNDAQLADMRVKDNKKVFDEVDGSLGWDEGVVEIDRSSIMAPFELVTFPLTPDDFSDLLQHSILNGDTPALALEVPSDTKIGCPPSSEDTLQILKTRPDIMPDIVRSYIEKMRLVVTIKQEIQLIALSVKNEELESYIEPLRSMLVAVEDEASVERSRCLHGGHELHTIDEILTSCKIHDSSTGLLLSQQDTSARHGDIVALRKKAAKLATMDAQSTGKARTSKLDQINEWLFNNLQTSSDNAALHRSMLPDGQILDEKAWARSVIKYWSIDEAAMGEEYLTSSSRGAVGSWSGSCEIPLQIKSDQRGGTSLPCLIKSVSRAHAVICMNSTYAVSEKAPRISVSRRAMEHLKALQRHFEI